MEKTGALQSSREKPEFIRRDWHKKTRFMRKKKLVWRKTRGMDNKMRLGFKGYARKVKIGWGNSKKERGKTQGLYVVRVENMKELSNVKKGYGVIIGSVGKKKKLELTKKAEEMKLTILNYRRPAKNAAK